jgi:hypothetical protein
MRATFGVETSTPFGGCLSMSRCRQLALLVRTGGGSAAAHQVSSTSKSSRARRDCTTQWAVRSLNRPSRVVLEMTWMSTVPQLTRRAGNHLGFLSPCSRPWEGDWEEAYLALAGATVELVRSMVRAGQTDALPELEDTLVSLHLAVLAGRPWPAGT